MHFNQCLLLQRSLLMMRNNMKILLYFAHPAQYLFFREALKILESKGHRIIVLIKTKDVLEHLLINDGVSYINILPVKRGNTKFLIFLSFLKRVFRILPILLKNRPDLLIGTDATIAQLGFLLRIKRITIIEDDYDVIASLASLTYPFTQTILCPGVCDVGKWNDKKVGYNGYMKLGYLHPNVFKSDIAILKKYNITRNYVLIRLSQLNAHHDFGMKGINYDLLKKIIEKVSSKGYQILISTEDPNPQHFTSNLLKINPSDLPHILSNATLLISDSQSMSVEAAVLGVPSIRYSGFVGKISVLEELEHIYGLTFGVKIDNDAYLLSKLDELLSNDNLREEFQKKRTKMLAEKIDVTSFLVWFTVNYPKSKQTMEFNPEYQLKFISVNN